MRDSQQNKELRRKGSQVLAREWKLLIDSASSQTRSLRRRVGWSFRSERQGAPRGRSHPKSKVPPDHGRVKKWGVERWGGSEGGEPRINR